MPARAATIALATAYQESKIYNLEHGDRDSLGLFQQRPSQGWGTREQILDPYYATNAFYDALAKVDGYESMRITEAAQEVQRSGFPEAYADHEADARVLASALTGHSPDGRSAACVRHADRTTSRTRLDRVRADRAGPTSYAGGRGGVRRPPARRLRARRRDRRPHGGVGALRRPGDRHLRPADRHGEPQDAAGRSRTTSSPRPTGSASTTSSSTTGSGRGPPLRGRLARLRPRRTDGQAGRDRAILEHRDHVHVDVFD